MRREPAARRRLPSPDRRERPILWARGRRRHRITTGRVLLLSAAAHSLFVYLAFRFVHLAEPPKRAAPAPRPDAEAVFAWLAVPGGEPAVPPSGTAPPAPTPDASARRAAYSETAAPASTNAGSVRPPPRAAESSDAGTPTPEVAERAPALEDLPRADARDAPSEPHRSELIGPMEGLLVPPLPTGAGESPGRPRTLAEKWPTLADYAAEAGGRATGGTTPSLGARAYDGPSSTGSGRGRREPPAVRHSGPPSLLECDDSLRAARAKVGNWTHKDRKGRRWGISRDGIFLSRIHIPVHLGNPRDDEIHVGTPDDPCTPPS